MTKNVSIPSSVEGKQLHLSGQDIKPQLNTPRKRNQKFCIPFTIKKKGSVKILEESIPKKFVHDPNALLNKGDIISGRQLWGFSQTLIREDKLRVGTSTSRTSSHSNQEVEVVGNPCYATIVESYSRQSLATHPKAMLQ